MLSKWENEVYQNTPDCSLLLVRPRIFTRLSPDSNGELCVFRLGEKDSVSFVFEPELFYLVRCGVNSFLVDCFCIYLAIMVQPTLLLSIRFIHS